MTMPINRLKKLILQKCSFYPGAELYVILSLLYTVINSSKDQASFILFYIATLFASLLASEYNGMFLKQFYLLPINRKDREYIVKQNYETRICIPLLFYVVVAAILLAGNITLIIPLILECIILIHSACIINIPLALSHWTDYEKFSITGLTVYRIVITFINLLTANFTVDIFNDFMHNNVSYYGITATVLLYIISVILTIICLKKYFYKAVAIQADYECALTLTEGKYENNNRS